MSAAVDVLAEKGYSSAFAGLVTGRSGISRLTFYELFDGGEDCFLAAFDEAVAQIAAEVTPAYLGRKGWREQIRDGLAALLACFDREPDLCSLVIVDALTVGPRVHERRASVLDSLIDAVDRGRSEGRAGREHPPVTAEGIVGGVFNVVHSRVLQRVTAARDARARGISPTGNISPAPAGSLRALCNPLMAMIVMPYLGHTAAARELKRPTPKARRSAPRAVRNPAVPRLNERALMILRVISTEPCLGNRQIAERVGLHDTGHISRLLLLLSDQGLILNESKNHPRGAKAWRLTGKGERV
ncbi:MAG TPA: TetR/AcrR family transcriptional regulator [Solirubrobacteraceae bacterium]|nr:TetR/AcrR family transcriptional regulator [Solirubrobacteraceae bacterium]